MEERPRLLWVNAFVFDELVAVRGGGDLGTGVAIRLWRAGFPVLILESTRPTAVRRTVSLSEAVYEGSKRVEDAEAILLYGPEEVPAALEAERIPLLVDPSAAALATVAASVVVDAIVAKVNTGTARAMAPLVIGLGPGFVAGADVHAVVETNRGPGLGRVIWHGPAEPNTGEPGAIGGWSASRVLRAPGAGTLRSVRAIGDLVAEGDTVAEVDGVAVRSTFSGLLRGLLRDGTAVTTGMKIGDVDPRTEPILCTRVSDKALAVAGGVLEAVVGRFHGRLSTCE